ncbi:MAG: hypothetical protein R3Y64_11015, partial [Peptostreptococcaceae bacterium]
GTDIKLSDKARENGGLKVIGTERAENRRIDNQLKGRSGRQGDVGESQFYVSFEDELAKHVQGNIKKVLDKTDQSLDIPISNKIFSNSINLCQKKYEGYHFQIRKTTLEYDSVGNKQRTLIYGQRDEILAFNKNELLEQLIKIIESVIPDYLRSKNIDLTIEDYLIESMNEIYSLEGKINKGFKSDDEAISFVLESMIDALKEKSKLENFTEIIKEVFVKKIDECWIENLIYLNDLREDVRFESLRGVNPINTYIEKSFGAFSDMINYTQIEMLKYVFQFNVVG